MLTFLRIFLFNFILISFVISDYQHIKEIGFKFWLDLGVEECYHELLEKGSRIYFMYEILNTNTHDDSIIVYFRNAYNGSIISITQTPQRGHLDFSTNETVLIDICMNHMESASYIKYLSVFFHIYHVEKILEQIKEIEQFDNSSINVHNIIDSITHDILRTREYQIELEMINQKDSYLIEKNYFWINQWALIHILIICSCFLFQTFFIKRLFQISKK